MNKGKKDIKNLINEYNNFLRLIIVFALWSFGIGIILVTGNVIFASIIFFAFVFIVGFFIIEKILAIGKEIEETKRQLNKQRK